MVLKIIVAKLILAIDIDDDLGRKAHLAGPVVGEQACIEAATRLATADPEDPDANVVFKAIKIYRNLKKRGEVEIALLSGHKDLGIKATKRIAQQLDVILKSFDVDSAIIVSDGISDETIMPVIESRVKVEATDVVYIKQAKELEKAYFLLLDKLKDPHYGKIILGIPALILMFLAFIQIFNIPWQYAAFLVGAYLLIKGFGIEERLSEAFDINVEGSLRFVITIILFLFLIVAFVIAISNYESKISMGAVVAYAASADVLANFIFFIILILSLWKTIISAYEKNPFRIFINLSVLVSVIFTFIFVKMIFKWVINDSAPYFSFADLVKYGLVLFFVAYVIHTYLESLKKNVIQNMGIEGMNVYNTFGDLLGSVYKVEEEKVVVKSIIGRKLELSFDKLVDIDKNGLRFKA
jgi:putative membrane protein